MCLFGFRLASGGGEIENIHQRSSSLESGKTLFFISITRRVILNPYQHGRKTQFFQEFLGRLFAKKARYSQVYSAFGRIYITQFSRSKTTSKWASRALPTSPSNLLSAIAPCLFSEQEMRMSLNALPPIVICFAVT